METKLDKLIDKLGITIACTKTGPRAGWEGDKRASHWNCTMRLEGRQISTGYSMGSAHNGTPTVASVLSSLMSDASAVEDSPKFEDFCSGFGYDTDSRKAEAIWKACKVLAPKLRKFLGKHYAKVQEAAQEY